MNIFYFSIGILGGILLLVGAACPDAVKPMHPSKSLKNQFFTSGTLMMLIYSVLNYYVEGGSVFFIVLQIFLLICSIMMMLKTPEKITIPAILCTGGGLIFVSLFFVHGFSTIIFILGLIGIGFGYTFSAGTVLRESSLVFGSLLISFFSYLESNWIFFWINAFFAVFSGYYMIGLLLKKHFKTKHIVKKQSMHKKANNGKH